MKHAFCLRFAYSLTLEYGLATKPFIITLILEMPWNQDDVIGCIFIFRWYIYLAWKNLAMCFEKSNIKTSFTLGVSKPASLDNNNNNKTFI